MFGTRRRRCGRRQQTCSGWLIAVLTRKTESHKQGVYDIPHRWVSQANITKTQHLSTSPIVIWARPRIVSGCMHDQWPQTYFNTTAHEVFHYSVGLWNSYCSWFDILNILCSYVCFVRFACTFHCFVRCSTAYHVPVNVRLSHILRTIVT